MPNYTLIIPSFSVNINAWPSNCWSYAKDYWNYFKLRCKTGLNHRHTGPFVNLFLGHTHVFKTVGTKLNFLSFLENENLHQVKLLEKASASRLCV